VCVQVRHFWLTHGLAFTPMHGSALYIDVGLVTHCSDPCFVRDKQQDLEGRYGEEQLSSSNSNSKLLARQQRGALGLCLFVASLVCG
jgi:hypothetical protein